ncbi:MULTISPECIES: hypothetical protein [Bacteroidota]|uniref:Uncharacterized protein n=1 Tax=Chryseobacterium takakiae TaxID=1302685 RepID=A0A1M5B0G6_9FLAO|nr:MULTISPECIES: hypothetical protein [Bacteroidota]UXM67904.1 hypothetical protein N7E57_01450 [Elizabethkingia anophelis]SHF35662.1 hypothetical protein SAMN05444408_1167 [Chryseobacterium takakiae]
MKIRDKNGNWIEVTDLKKAIRQTGGGIKNISTTHQWKATRKGRHIGQICTRN